MKRNGQGPASPSTARAGAALFGAALATLLAAAPAGADDTEVFFGQTDPTRSARPNVLFVLDTSGSMNWGETDWEAPQAGRPSRLGVLKSAMDEVLDSSSEVNVGLMRMNGLDGGGAVIFPITPIDANVCEDGGCDVLATSSRVLAEADNAEENVHSGHVATNGNILSMGRENGGGKNSEQAVGIRMADLDVPHGATIESAELEFTARYDDAGTASLEIRVESDPDADPYAHGSNESVTSRGTLESKVDWTITENWVKDENYSVDVEALVADAVTQDDWCGGQAIGFVISGAEGNKGNRDGYTYRSGVDRAPRLRVTYRLDPTASLGDLASRGCQIQTTSAKLGDQNDDVIELFQGSVFAGYYQELPYATDSNYGDQAGFRFANVAVPQGADVVGARIELVHQFSRSGDVRFEIRAEKKDDAKKYESGKRHDLTKRSYTGPVVWNVTEDAVAGRSTVAGGLGDIVGQVVGRSGWESGNAMAFKIDGTSTGYARRSFVPHDVDPARSARLSISYKSTVPFLAGSGTLIARDAMKAQLQDLRADGGTPVVDALREATRYFLGEPVASGLSRGVAGEHDYAYRREYHRVSDPRSWTGGIVDVPEGCDAADPNNPACKEERVVGNPVYDAQLERSCQVNSIVVLTDGAPSGGIDTGSIESLIGAQCDPALDEDTGRCAPELAAWLSGNDLNPVVAGDQRIKTHTVNLNLVPDPGPEDTSDEAATIRADNLVRRTFLNSVARAGDGRMFEASDTSSLVDAFRTILSSVNAIDTAFTAPGATVNQYNRLTHRDDIYFAVFRPDDTPLWAGNLKKYKVSREKDAEGNDIAGTAIEIRGADKRPAVDPDTGFFAKDAQSFWVPQNNGGSAVERVDGDRVQEGGAAGQMENVSSRKLYTYLGKASGIPARTGIELDSSDDYRFTEDNADITSEMLGLQDVHSGDRAARRTKLLRWARGVDVNDDDLDGRTDDSRRHVGDPMHSRPVILNYAGDKSIIYLTTNEGFLHAIDTENGSEKWAFMPEHLFGNIDAFFENDATTKHPYGLDGQVSVWRDDPNQNYVVDRNERAMLFAGMRRGGRNYYGFDVTDHDDPKLAWTIEGGKAGDDFEELGQSWSRATPARMQIRGAVRDVLIFGGGYDEAGQDPDYDEDAERSQPTDTMGRAVFIVDALTGQKLWSVGHKDAAQVDTKLDRMKYGIPSDVRVVDVDLDGLADQLYAADMGGQVWRFDVQDAHTSGSLLQGGVIAKLNGNREENHRRFYNEPDVAVIEKDGKRFMSIAIGSGWRAHPLDQTVQDRFYVIKSPFVRIKPGARQYGRERADGTGWRPIREPDLVDVAKAKGVPEANDYGWFLDFATTGEKVLGKSVTFDNSVVFSTYVPEATTASRPCEPSIGGGRAYVLSAIDGYPTRNISGRDNSADFATRDVPDDKIDVADRSKNLMHGGIPPEPAILITEDGTPIVVFGPEKLDTGFDNGTKRTFWADRGAAEVRGREEPVTVSEDETL